MTASPPYRYIKDPAEIYRESARLIREASDLSALPDELHDVAIRLIHTCGRPDVVTGLRASAGAAEAGRKALVAGKPILCDVEMV